jgi:hypothetical protein
MIVANLATYPPRLEQLKVVVPIIAPQVDRLNIVLNQYDTVPSELAQYGNVFASIPADDCKDTGKFLPDVHDAEFVFLIDDDIVYPPDYVSASIRHFEAITLPRCIGGYHGTTYRSPRLRQLLRSPGTLFTYKQRAADFRRGFSLFDGLESPTVVDQIGTGTTILRGKDMPPFDFFRGSQKFVDVRLARWCFEQRIFPVCLPRSKNWIKGLPIEESIFQSFTITNPPHVNDEILTFAYKTRYSGMKESEVILAMRSAQDT